MFIKEEEDIEGMKDLMKKEMKSDDEERGKKDEWEVKI